MSGSPLPTRVRNRVERLRQHRWRMAPYASGERHIVMGGAPRSGTTVLRKLFDRHPEICSGAETKLFVPAAYNLEWLARTYGMPLGELVALRDGSTSQAAFIDAFAARVRSEAGKVRWAEKTPQNIRHLDWISHRFPQASIVHIIRDGRDRFVSFCFVLFGFNFICFKVVCFVCVNLYTHVLYNILTIPPIFYV